MKDRALTGLAGILCATLALHAAVPALPQAKSARIVVDQVLGGVVGQYPFVPIAERLLGYAGIVVTRSEADPVDLIITITARGTAQGPRYEARGLAQSVAFVSGTITVADSSGGVVRKDYHGTKSPSAPPVGLSSTQDPYRVAFASPGSFIQRFLEALSELSGPQVITAALSDGAAPVRRNAAEILGVTGGPGAVEALVIAVKDDYPEVRKAALDALGSRRDERSVLPLVEVMERYSSAGNLPMRAGVAQTLRTITGRDLGPEPSRWRRWLEERKLTPTPSVSPTGS